MPTYSRSRCCCVRQAQSEKRIIPTSLRMCYHTRDACLLGKEHSLEISTVRPLKDSWGNQRSSWPNNRKAETAHPSSYTQLHSWRRHEDPALKRHELNCSVRSYVVRHRRRVLIHRVSHQNIWLGDLWKVSRKNSKAEWSIQRLASQTRSGTLLQRTGVFVQSYPRPGIAEEVSVYEPWNFSLIVCHLLNKHTTTCSYS